MAKPMLLEWASGISFPQRENALPKVYSAASGGKQRAQHATRTGELKMHAWPMSRRSTKVRWRISFVNWVISILSEVDGKRNKIDIITNIQIYTYIYI